NRSSEARATAALSLAYRPMFAKVRGSIYALILALVMSSISEITAKPSNPRFIFMSPESDPFVDSYMKTISRMSTKEIMNLPKLSDVEFLDQLERGYDFIPGKKT
ncbi:unnamed protein product, partial [Rotaria sp. Silwood1]